jgi:hypothetical protein
MAGSSSSSAIGLAKEPNTVEVDLASVELVAFQERNLEQELLGA